MFFVVGEYLLGVPWAFELREEIGQFMEQKGKPVAELQDAEWLQDLAFMMGITDHLNNLNKMMQGRNKVVTQYYDSICALWEMQLSNRDPPHFPRLQNVRATGNDVDMDWYKNKITGLLWEFQQRFQIFGEVETEFTVFCSPFTDKASDLPMDIQLEVIDL